MKQAVRAFVVRCARGFSANHAAARYGIGGGWASSRYGHPMRALEAVVTHPGWVGQGDSAARPFAFAFARCGAAPAGRGSPLHVCAHGVSSATSTRTGAHTEWPTRGCICLFLFCDKVLAQQTTGVRYLCVCERMWIAPSELGARDESVWRPVEVICPLSASGDALERVERVEGPSAAPRALSPTFSTAAGTMQRSSPGCPVLVFRGPTVPSMTTP
ncbi:hypothetical protein C8Q80DRAFT_28606 [Daedaleopsis nitida]|nr:hypothetical protein C8Q80DRAFT_28606 [Daedaleopsis nitida]